MAAASCALSSSAPAVRSATLLSGNQVDALDRYNSSRRVHSTSTSLIRTAAHGRTQLPIRISTTTVQGLHERRSWKLVRPSAIAVGPRDNNNWVETEWNSFTQVAPSSPSSPSQRNTKGWTDGNGVEESRVVAQLRNIAFAAKDRSEMHAIIGVQRDNWNKLCHMTVNMTTIAAAMLAAMNNGVAGSTSASFGMSMAAFLLNGGAAGFMFLASKFQPSQLAEEQRTASRFFKMLARDIETTLLIDPRLRKAVHLYMDDVMDRLEALDVAFPLPLTPNGLVKFPQEVVPSVLGSTADLSETEILANNTNGWSNAMVQDLKHTAEKLKESDIEIYLGWARNKERDNKRLAMLAPVLAGSAALLSLLGCCQPGIHLAALASACSIAAVFGSSFSNGGQIGMIFELYRNCAGYYEQMVQDIQSTIRVPVCQREDGELYHQKIALKLGRRDNMPLFSSEEKTAGKLF
ncbi:hypothetical protein CY35_09G027800 [Sphagnum magellanicum]|jgi:hypothetical protein|nr:hypothetical protein CY35_09G027700 [Sphagnum magellanicum]KAH9551721.1 hypothetical protein CY35_09G027800 [Sphagnum magellanicum]